MRQTEFASRPRMQTFFSANGTLAASQSTGGACVNWMNRVLRRNVVIASNISLAVHLPSTFSWQINPESVLTKYFLFIFFSYRAIQCPLSTSGPLRRANRICTRTDGKMSWIAQHPARQARACRFRHNRACPQPRLSAATNRQRASAPTAECGSEFPLSTGIVRGSDLLKYIRLRRPDDFRFSAFAFHSRIQKCRSSLKPPSHRCGSRRIFRSFFEILDR